MPSYFIWDSAYLVWARLHLQCFCNMCILGHYMSILLFPAPPHHQYGKCSKYCWCILTICIYVWVLKPWSNSFFCCCGSLFLNGTFGHGNMTCWPKCNVCVLVNSVYLTSPPRFHVRLRVIGLSVVSVITY